MPTETLSKLCSRCDHRTTDADQNIICGIFNHSPDFVDQCNSFHENLRSILENDYKLYINQPASMGQRFANLLVDIICALILSIIILFFFGITVTVIVPNTIPFIKEHDQIGYFILLIGSIIYYTLLEATLGRSVGKLITRTKVVTADGGKPGFRLVLKRTICRFIPFEPFSFFFGTVGGWHDRFTDTKVVRV